MKRLFLRSLLLFLTACLWPGLVKAHDLTTGCQHIITPKGIELGIWYPSVGTPVHQDLGPYAQDCVKDGPIVNANTALVIISHGTGGSWTSHLDTAAALSRGGYIVVALTEPGDNWKDSSHATDLTGRTRAMSAALDYMLTLWPYAGTIDHKRIGAFGFSAGGLTTLLAAGAKADLSQIGPWCSAYPKSFTCTLIGKRQVPLGATLPSLLDRRLSAIVVAAPALGFTMTRAALSSVTQPVQIWQAGNDRILPSPSSVEPVRDNLPGPPEVFLIPRAGHFDFLAPCRTGFTQLPICQSAPGFDRKAFHMDFNAALVGFFNRVFFPPHHLPNSPPAPDIMPRTP